MTTINGCKAQNKENKDSLQQKIEKNKNDLHQKSVNLLRFTGYRVTCQPVTFLKLFIKKT